MKKNYIIAAACLSIAVVIMVALFTFYPVYTIGALAFFAWAKFGA